MEVVFNSCRDHPAASEIFLYSIQSVESFSSFRGVLCVGDLEDATSRYWGVVATGGVQLKCEDARENSSRRTERPV